MTLKYGLVENLMTERPDDYMALTYSVAGLDRNAIIDRMLARGTALTKTDILGVLNALEETVSEAVQQGYSINMPLINTSFSISGVFEGPMDNFDGNRHKLNVNITKGVLLREAEKRVKLEKTVASSVSQPQIQEVKDSVSGTVNLRLTSRGVVEVRGYNLKIDGDDPACGLWFEGSDGQQIKAEIIIENKPSKIIAIIPALVSGEYQVKVITQYTGGGTFLKTPKIFLYPRVLTVENEQ